MSRSIALSIAFAVLLSACGGDPSSPSSPAAPLPSPSTIASETTPEGVPASLVPAGWTLVKQATLADTTYLIFRSSRTLEEAQAEYAAQLSAAGVVFTELFDPTGVLFVFAADFDPLAGLDQDHAALIAVPTGDGTQLSLNIRVQP